MKAYVIIRLSNDAVLTTKVFFSCDSTVLWDPGHLTYRRFLELFRHMVALLGRVISPLQGLYLHRTTQHRKTRTNIHALSGIRTYDPSNQPAKTHASDRTATVTGNCWCFDLNYGLYNVSGESSRNRWKKSLHVLRYNSDVANWEICKFFHCSLSTKHAVQFPKFLYITGMFRLPSLFTSGGKYKSTFAQVLLEVGLTQANVSGVFQALSDVLLLSFLNVRYRDYASHLVCPTLWSLKYAPVTKARYEYFSK
jgi:hypothetical protein